MKTGGGYFELTRDAKREPLKKRLHPKPLGSKSPNNPPKLLFKKKIEQKQTQKKDNFFPGKKDFSTFLLL
jgi:hypothetical protein